MDRISLDYLELSLYCKLEKIHKTFKSVFSVFFFWLCGTTTKLYQMPYYTKWTDVDLRKWMFSGKSKTYTAEMNSTTEGRVFCSVSLNTLCRPLNVIVLLLVAQEYYLQYMAFTLL